MSDSTHDHLRPAQFGGVLGLKPRQVARISAELDALGYALVADVAGGRRIHPELALAVKETREAQRDLLSLRLDPTLNKFLRKGRAAEPEALEVLIEVAAEVGIVREVAAALAEGTRKALPGNMIAPEWKALGLPDPRSGL